MSTEARLALLLLEEVELRGGKVRLRFLKVYRLVAYWLGKNYAGNLISKLVASGYLSIKDDSVELLRRFKANRTIMQVYREARELVISTYLAMQRPLSR
jgi:hypothetical protein